VDYVAQQHRIVVKYIDVVIITISRPKLSNGCSAKRRRIIILIVDELKITRFDPSRTSSGFFP